MIIAGNTLQIFQYNQQIFRKTYVTISRLLKGLLLQKLQALYSWHSHIVFRNSKRLEFGRFFPSLHKQAFFKSLEISFTLMLIAEMASNLFSHKKKKRLHTKTLRRHERPVKQKWFVVNKWPSCAHTLPFCHRNTTHWSIFALQIACVKTYICKYAVTLQYITLSAVAPAGPNNLLMTTNDNFKCQPSFLSHSAFESAW